MMSVRARAWLPVWGLLCSPACTTDRGPGAADGEARGDAAVADAAFADVGEPAPNDVAAQEDALPACPRAWQLAPASLPSPSTRVARAPYGLEERPQSTTCRAFSRPTGEANDPFPQTLAATGCFDRNDLRQPVPGLIPYDVNAPLWSDAANKRRWMVLPAASKITIAADGDLDLPVGTMLLKSFELDGKMLETRFMVRHEDGGWAGYTYAWDPAGANAATLVPPEGGQRRVGFETWIFPSRASCSSCHTEAAGHSLGLELGQLDRDYVYAGDRRANQLDTLEHLGVFATPLGAARVRYANPSDPNAALDSRARAYLHGNCSHCHRPGGLVTDGNVPVFDLRWQTPLAMTGLLDVAPVRGDFGIPGVALLAPGHAARSMLVVRMKTTVANVRMPAIGSTVVDGEGVALVEAWIAAMSPCR